jgi:hypothetical protein
MGRIRCSGFWGLLSASPPIYLCISLALSCLSLSLVLLGGGPHCNWGLLVPGT